MANNLGSLGVMSVGFVADLASLSTVVAAAREQLSSLEPAAEDVGVAISEGLSAPESTVSNLAESLTGLDESLSTVASSADEASSGVDEGLATIGDAASSAAESVSGSMSSISESTNQAASDVQSAANDAGGGLGGFAQKSFMAYMSLQGFGQMAQSLASNLLAPAATAEQTGVAFDTLMHSATKARAELAALDQFAAHTPFQTEDINQAGEKLLAFGFSAQQVIPDITAIGDSLSALGRGDAANLSGVVDIFGKIQAQGKLTAVDMMQLSTYGIPAWKMLAEAMHVTVPQLQAMVSKGLDAKTALDGLQKGMEATFGGGMAKQANTFTGLMSTIISNAKEGWDAILGVSGGQVEQGSIFSMVEQGLSHISNELASPGFATFAKTVSHDVTGALSGLGPVVSFLDSNMGDFLGILEHGGGIVESVGGLFLNLSKTVLEDANKSGLLHDILSTLSTILGDVDGTLQTLTGDAEQFVGGLIDAATKSGAFQSVLKAIKDILPDVDGFLTTVGSDIVQNVLPPLENLVTNVGHAVSKFADWLDKSGTAKQALHDLSGVVGTLSGAAGTLVGWVSQLVGFLDQNTPAADALKDALKGVAGAFVAMKVLDFVKSIQNMVSNIQTAASNFLKFAGDIKDNVMQALHGFSNDGLNELKTNLQGAENKADESTTKMETDFEEVGASAETAGTDISTDISTGADEASTDVGEASAKMELDLDSVGTAAVGAGAEIEAIGPEALTAEGEAKTAMAGVEEAAGAAKLAISGAIGLAGGLLALEDQLRQLSPQGGTIYENGKPVKVQNIWNAQGTTNWPGGLSWVGEQGPELIDVPPGSNIYSNPRSMGIMQSMAPVIHVHNYIDGREMTDVVGQRMIKMIYSTGPVKGGV